MEQAKQQEAASTTGLPLRRFLLLFALLCLIWLGTETARTAPQVESGGKTGVLGIGAPYSSVISDPSLPLTDFFQSYSLGIDPNMKLGPGRLQLDGFSGTATMPTMTVPFIKKGFAPADAKLKIGGLYVNVPSVTSEVLWTDNANQVENGRKSGTISMVRAPVDAVLQLNEGLQLALSGNVMWLPFEGKAGIEGFGWNESFDLNMDATMDSAFRAGLSYDFELGGWDVTFNDTFSIEDWTAQANASARLARQLRMLKEQNFEGVDRIGRYSYGGSGPGAGRSQAAEEWKSGTTAESRFTKNDLYYVNRAQLSARRMLPTVAECNVSVYRDDYWYSKERRGRTRWSHGLNAVLVSVRESLRFKPYATFTTDQTDQDDGWNKTVRVGMRGPVSDYIEFDGNVGYYEPADQKYHDFLYYLSLAHTPGPLTRQQITWERFISQPGRELTDALRYELLRKLGPDLTGSFLTAWNHYESRRGTQEERDEYNAGLRFDYTVAPKWTYQLTGLYTTQTDSNDRNTLVAYDEWDAIFSVIFNWSPTFFIQGTYEYRDYNSRAPGDSYYENLVILKATKTF